MLFPPSLPSRLLLIFFALLVHIIAEILLWAAGETGNNALVFLALLVWFSWFALVFLVAMPRADSLLRPYRKVIYIAATVIMILMIIMGLGEVIGLHLLNSGAATESELSKKASQTFQYGDDTALVHQASLNYIDGKNPYSNVNIVKAAEEFDVPITRLTALRKGAFADVFPEPTEDQMAEALRKAKEAHNDSPEEFISVLCYAPGSFILPAPFVALGLEDIRFFYMLCALVLAAFVLWKSPRGLRPLVVAFFLANLMLWNDVAGGRTDAIYLLLLLLGWTSRRQLLLSALFMGLAAATKQFAWLYILFYLVLLLREVGWKRTLQALGVIAAIFTIVNLFFFLDAPQPWLEGVLSGFLTPFFPLGNGIVTLSIAGIMPDNRLIFTVMELTVLLLGLAWYYKNCTKYPQAGLLLAVLPYFFSWLSYSRYFCNAAILVFGAVTIEEYRGYRAGKQAQLATNSTTDG